MKKKQIKNYDADAAVNNPSVASAHGATGLMFDPPRTDAEFASLEDVQTLEVPVPPFNYNDKPLPHDEQCIYPRIKKGGKANV